MDSSKKAAFVRAMGKRQKMAKGGMIKKLANRQYYADGDTVTKMSMPAAPAAVPGVGGPTDSGTQSNARNPNTGILGTIGGALGLNNNFQAAAANIQPGTNAAQINAAYQGVQGALANQQGLANTLSPQAEQAVANQAALAQQYYNMTQGIGPNPALAQLNQATSQNVANQAALMAGQRGAAANAGLLARQAAQQGAQTQQQAVGQAATLQAQQQIAAQQNLANLAAQQVGQAGQAVSGVTQAQQAEQQILQNAIAAQNNANVGMQSNINNVNAQTAAGNQGMMGNILGGITSAASGIASKFFAEGGEVKSDSDHHMKLAEMNAHSLRKYADGGDVKGSFDTPGFQPTPPAPAPQIGATPSIEMPKPFAGGGSKDGGGGGAAGIMKMIPALAALADGGEVRPQIMANPLVGASPQAAAAPWGNFQVGPMSVGGPQIQGTPQFAQSMQSPDFGEKVKKGMETYFEGKKERDAEKEINSEVGGENDWWRDENPEAGTVTGSKFDEHLAHGGSIKGHFHNYFAEGGAVPAMVSPGEIYLSPREVDKVMKEGKDPASLGHKFKGKAKVKGDSYANDTIPATLEEGGVVISRENVGSKEKRKTFVKKALMKKRSRG